MSQKLLVVLSFLIMAAATEGSFSRMHQRAPSAQERLIGTWELVTTQDNLKDGTTRFYPDAGPRGMGFLIYTADGHMCAQIMNPDRPAWKDADRPTQAEKASAFDGFSSYCGRYDVDESKNLIHHYPETAWLPGYAGTNQRRPFKLQGDLLTFADRVTDEPGVESYSITWRKWREKRTN